MALLTGGGVTAQLRSTYLHVELDEQLVFDDGSPRHLHVSVLSGGFAGK